jgi:drug/metabolite transporter (DMT)-like permease
MIAGSALLTSSDAVVKWLSDELPVGQIMTLRGLVVMALISAVLTGGRQVHALRVHNRRDLALRALMVVLATFLFLVGLRYMPLADATAIAFATPLFTTALAVPLLGEQVGWRRWTAVVVGFGGVLLAAQPSGSGIAWAALLPLGAALCAALRDIATRRLHLTEASMGILFYTSAAVTLSGLITVPWGWQAVSLEAWGLLALSALVMTAAHYFQIEAFRYADTATVAPFRYFALVWAVVLGFLIWGSLPGWMVTAGILVIAGSGLYIWHREVRVR